MDEQDGQSLNLVALDRLLWNEPPASPKERSCFNCAHLLRESESWEMPHIRWYECKARPSNVHLKSFPFRNTKCKHWVKKKPPTL